ncbi:MAG: hypothetical protein JO370_13285 [Paucibacter sp.]|nr:hypothetical protein [Roseateles sp.]
MITAAAAQAQSLLRDTSHFQWYVIPFLLVVIQAFGEQIAEKRWSVVLGAAAFWLMDWFNEIVNGLVFHFSGYAPIWATPGSSALVLLIGLNIEITFMFALMGLFAMRTLPADTRQKILGLARLERRQPLADLAARLHALLPGRLLGARHEDREAQGRRGRPPGRPDRSGAGRVRLRPGLDLKTGS